MADYRIILIATLIIFMVIATLMTVVSLGNALRLRNVKLTWKSGKMKGYPLFSTLFLTGILIGIAAHIFLKKPIDLPVFVGYTWIGLNWYVTSFLSSKRYITDHGIVKNINDPSQTIAWNQISDYIEREEQNALHFVFIYTKHPVGTHTESAPVVRRIELTVPKKRKESFNKLLEYKLGRRFSNYSYSLTGFESIN